MSSVASIAISFRGLGTPGCAGVRLRFEAFVAYVNNAKVFQIY